ncbi:MAG: response regulator [Candidatus Eisenbacteria bacterium]|nr:response regulator [Candidatus Eisenbacteria bacterium]
MRMEKRASERRDYAPAASRPHHLLLATGEAGIASQLKDWVENDPQFGLAVVRTGRQLLRRLAHETPDLILCDLALPGADGITVLRQLRPPAPPVVMLSAATQEAARAATEALRSGAADYVIKKGQGGESRLTITPAMLRRRLLRHLERPSALRDRRVCGEWLRLLPEGSRRRWQPSDSRAVFPAHAGWTGFVLASPAAIGALLRSLAEAPQRPGGAMLLQVPQPLCYSRALAEAATRHWNRLVLEYVEQETLRSGQWRILPGRTLLAPGSRAAGREARRDTGRGGWHRTINRISDPEAALRRQIALLGGATESVRLYLFDPPCDEAVAMLQSLVDRGHAVCAHAGCLATAAEPRMARAPVVERSDPRRWLSSRPTVGLEAGLRRVR